MSMGQWLEYVGEQLYIIQSGCFTLDVGVYVYKATIVSQFW